MKFEKRYNQDENFRAVEEDGKRYLEGYAAKFNVRSKLIFEGGRLFTETLERGAFDNVLDNDVILTFNHSKDKVMARTTSGTLELNTDDVGLKFRAELPNNVSHATDTYELVKRGDLNANSFAFFVTKEGQTWSKDTDGNPVRSINEIKKLSDVSVVTNAAYPETEIAARSLAEVEAEVEEEVTDEVTEEVVEEVVEEEELEVTTQDIINELEKLKMKLKITKIK